MIKDLERQFKVQFSHEYYFKTENLSEENYCKKLDDSKFIEESSIVSTILSLQVMYFLGRRIAGVDGIHNDNISYMISKLKQDYKKLSGKEYIDFNEDVDW